MLVLRRKFFLSVLAIILATPAMEASAQTTVWNWIGIPQGVNRVRDGLVNKHGFFPGLERKPKLLRIGDPALAGVDNAAIKKAQQIKAEEDLAPQKIKAIKYLAKMGCGTCYKGVDEAMLEAMKDCTEKVRLTAVKAIGKTGNKKCPQCDNSCCSEKITEQLAKIAYERDPDHPDCWYEPSKRVREAAKEAIKGCCQGGPLPVEQVPAEPPAIEPESREPQQAEPEAKQAEAGSSTLNEPVDPNVYGADAYGDTHAYGDRGAYSDSVSVEPPAIASDDVVGSERVVELPATESRSVWVSDHDGVEAARSRPVDSYQPIEPTDGIADNGAADEDVVEPLPQLPNVVEQPSDSPTIRQPSTLTLRAQRPALQFAAPAKIQPQLAKTSAGLSQPSSLIPVSHGRPAQAPKRMAPKRVAQERVAPKRVLSLDPIRNMKSLIPIATFIPQPRPTAVKKTSATKASARKTPARQKEARSAGGARGTVARVSIAAGTVQVRFRSGHVPRIGSLVHVSHQYLLNRAELGELEIIAVGSTMATARPIGGMKLSRIQSGDQVILQTR